MVRGLNKVLLIGHLGKDPELKYLASGVPITTFTLAVSRGWRTPDGEQRDKTEWFHCVAWRQLAETTNQYLRKGRRIYLEGRLHTRRWQDEAGHDHSVTEVELDELLMLDGRPDHSLPEGAAAAEAVEDDGDLPF